jgi:uncharacterized protein with HEPN domain
MSSREVNKLLFDLEKACERILTFIEGRNLQDFLHDEMLRSAVERQSEIIGEALHHALGLDPSLRDRITDLDRIISFRNRLIHGYSTVSPQIVWGIVSNDVPILLSEVRAIMDKI